LTISNSKIQLLIVEDEELIREILAVMLAEKYDVDVFEAAGGNSAVEILQHNKIDLIVSDLNMPNGSGDIVYSFNKENNKAAFIFITSVDINRHQHLEDFFDQKDHYYLPKPFTQEQVFSAFDNIFKDVNTHKEQAKQSISDSNYSSIPIELAHHLSPEIGAIYIKINKLKYLKYLDKVVHGDLDKFSKLKVKGCQEIYVLASKYEHWIKSRFIKIKENLNMMNNSIDSSEAAIKSILQLSRVVFNVGSFPKIFVLDFEDSVQNIVTNLWNTKNLKGTVQEILNRSSVIQTHSSVCLFLCKLVNSKINFNDKAKYKKLALSSLFHDITLIAEDDTQYLNYDQLNNANLSQNKKDFIFQHSFNSAKQLEIFPVFDLDTLSIIKHHHELPQGQGYPGQSDLKGLKLLSRQFNIIHFVSYIIAQSGQFSKSDYYAVRDVFDDQEFLIILDVIYKCFNASDEE
jgi:response regulator RpfG family c-di-GMP phosphodiesterase